jgi:hypothetical protein
VHRSKKLNQKSGVPDYFSDEFSFFIPHGELDLKKNASDANSSASRARSLRFRYSFRENPASGQERSLNRAAAGFPSRPVSFRFHRPQGPATDHETPN